MMTELNPFTPTESSLYLEILPVNSHPPAFSNHTREWIAYLNQICVNTLLPWFQEDYPRAKIWPQVQALPAIWELVNGTAIALNPEIRLILIPSSALDHEELRVPQEWLDLPDWAADYYLSVQVNPDEGWLNVWGCATHHQLKTLGTYDSGDRTYSLPEDLLIRDFNALLLAREFATEEVIRADIAPLSPLPETQAQNLLQRLGSADVIWPRLQIPFEQWGALVQNETWRRSLYQRRLGQPEPWSVTQWLQSGVSQFAQSLGWQAIHFEASLVGARGSETLPTTALRRLLTIQGKPYELWIRPQGEPDHLTWRFELRAANPGEPVSPGLTLRLLTEDLQPFEKNEVTAIQDCDRLYLRVAIASGDGLIWEIEPTPENYTREILRF